MKKAEKTFFVANLTEEIKAANSLVLIDFAGMAVKTQQELKKRLKEVKARMIVVKNTLFKRAGEAAKIDSATLADSVLTGQTALIISEKDPIAPLQVLYKFAKEFDVPQLKVGIIEGSFQDTEALTTLSKLPSKEILLAQTVGAIAAPIYGLMRVLQANIQKLVYLLKKQVIKESPSEIDNTSHGTP